MKNVQTSSERLSKPDTFLKFTGTAHPLFPGPSLVSLRVEGGMLMQSVGTDETIGLIGRQTAKVSHRDSHFGTGDVMCVIFKVHTQIIYRNLIHKGFRNSNAHF